MRERGWYWVKLAEGRGGNRRLEWAVAFWDTWDGNWYLVENELALHDHEFSVIGPKIEPPA